MLARRFLIPVIACLFALSAAEAQAGFEATLTVTTAFDAVELNYDYAYLLTNSSETAADGDPFLLVDFSVDLPTSASLTDITVPDGWFFTYEPGDSLVEWTILDFSKAIPPGRSLNFGFSSVLPPGVATFSVVALNTSDAGFDQGSTQGPLALPPSSVPEPSSLVMLASGVAALCGFSRRKRSR